MSVMLDLLLLFCPSDTEDSAAGGMSDVRIDAEDVRIDESDSRIDGT